MKKKKIKLFDYKNIIPALFAVSAILGLTSVARAGGVYNKTKCYFLFNDDSKSETFTCYVHVYGDVHTSLGAIWRERFGQSPLYAYQKYFDYGNPYIGTRYFNGESVFRDYGNSSQCAQIDSSKQICYIWRGGKRVEDAVPKYPEIR